MSNVQPLTTLGEASGDLLKKLAAPAQAPKAPRKEKDFNFAPQNDGIFAAKMLVDVFAGDRKAAAEAVGHTPSFISNIISGKMPCRKSTLLAMLKVAEDKTAKTSVAQQTVAVVVVPKDRGDDLSAAVRSIGGTFSPLSFEGNGVAL